MSANEQAARAEAEKRWPNWGGDVFAEQLSDHRRSGFVIGAEWQREQEHRQRCPHVRCPGGSLCCCLDGAAALLARLSDPDDALAEEGAKPLALHEYRVDVPDWVPYCTCGWRAERAYDGAAFDAHVVRAVLAAVAARLAGGEQA